MLGQKYEGGEKLAAILWFLTEFEWEILCVCIRSPFVVFVFVLASVVKLLYI